MAQELTDNPLSRDVEVLRAQEKLYAAQTLELIKEDENVIWVGETGFEAYGEQLIALVDEFRSGWECPRCMNRDIRTEGSGYTQKQFSVIPCEECKGEGQRPKVGNPNLKVRCTNCDARGYIACPECKGTGGSVTTPKSSEGAPTTGRLVSIGSDVVKGVFVLGHRVMFSSYAGTEYTMKAKSKTEGEREVRLRYLVARDILSHLYGVLEYRQLRSAKQLHTNQ